MPPDPPSISMLRMLIMFCTIVTNFLNWLYVKYPDHTKIGSYTPDIDSSATHGILQRVSNVCRSAHAKHLNKFFIIPRLSHRQIKGIHRDT